MKFYISTALALALHLFPNNCVVVANVSCGGHYAPTCAECPQGNGAAWCNGECQWVDNTCTEFSIKCGNGITADKCSNCPATESGCGDTDCAWHTETELCRDAFSDDVRTASVHLFYPKPLDRPAWWFQRVVPVASADATYFSSNGHRFGYGGIQEVNDSTGRVIFSLWDQGGCDQDVAECDPSNLAQTTACGTGVTCSGFGGEGTGRKSFYDTDGPFENGQDYFFVTQAKYLGNRRMEYTGYFHSNGTWRLISRIQVSTNANEVWWIDGMYSFVEQWTARETTQDRAAMFGPSFVADETGETFLQVESATFSHGTLENHERVNAWQAGEFEKYAVGLETGGSTIQQVPRNEVFTYVPVAPYPELNEFTKYIGCLNNAVGTTEIEQCFVVEPEEPNEPEDSVNCGGHRAASCDECPEGNGASWCNGECTWISQINACTRISEYCVDDVNWRDSKKDRSCDWVARRPARRCRKRGYIVDDPNGATVRAQDACQDTCNEICQE